MSNCLDCLSIMVVPSMTAASECLIKPQVGGYQDVIIAHCGIKFVPPVLGQNAISAFLAGTSMPLSAAAIVIAIAHGAPVGTTSANITDAVTWGLLGTMGKGVRGMMNNQDTITHTSGSCQQPEIVNNVWRIGIKFTRVGHAGTTPDYDLMEKFLSNSRAYHVIVVECGETTGAAVLPAGSFVVSSYKFDRPEDGIREFLQREISFDTVKFLEPRSYGFPTYADVVANFT